MGRGRDLSDAGMLDATVKSNVRVHVAWEGFVNGVIQSCPNIWSNTR